MIDLSHGSLSQAPSKLVSLVEAFSVFSFEMFCQSPSEFKPLIKSILEFTFKISHVFILLLNYFCYDLYRISFIHVYIKQLRYLTFTKYIYPRDFSLGYISSFNNYKIYRVVSTRKHVIISNTLIIC